MTSARSIITVVAATAVVGAFTWSAFQFLRAPEPALDVSAAAANAGAREAAAESTKSSDQTGDRASLAATVTAVEPRLEWPDEESLRRLERSGRALFGGVVRAPDGTPCPGATVWCDGAVVATTDERGAWQADVPCFRLADGEETTLWFGQHGIHWLEARKEGVGYASEGVELPSRRIDLALAAGLAFSGTVVDFDDGAPIGGAELELRRSTLESDRGFSLTMRADAQGGFSFPNLPEGAVYVRGRAPGYDSNGFFGYDFSKGRDIVVRYRLRRQFTVHGRFVPWPVAGVAVERASLRATTRSPHDRGNSKLESRGTIGPDGRFEMPLAVCPSCVLDLLVDTETYWSDVFDTNEERGEFDAGDIPLLPAASLIGRFEAPDDVRARIAVSVSISTPDGKHVGVRGRLDAAGTFRFAPLPPGGASVRFALGRNEIANLENAGGLDDDERSVRLVTLLAGGTRDVGVVTTPETVVYGTVRDGDGMPVAWADLEEAVQIGAGRWADVFDARSEADGLYAGLRELGRVGDGDEARALQGRASFEVSVDGHLSRRFDVEWPASDHWVRRDLVLATGVALRGTLVDDAGAPCRSANITVTAGEDARLRFGSDTTRADGSFEIRGLAAGAYRVIASDASGAHRFDDVHPENGPVTLRPADATKR